MSKLLFAIKNLDLITQKPSLYINKMERSKSTYGAFLTTLLVILSVGFIAYYLLKLFGRTDISFVTTELKDDNSGSIDLSAFPIFFSLTQNSDSTANLNNLFTIQAKVISYTDGYDGTNTPIRSYNYKTLSYTKCNANNFNSSYIVPDNIEKYYCLQEGNLYRTLGSESYLSISVIGNSSALNNKGLLLQGGFQFNFGYFKTFIDAHEKDLALQPENVANFRNFRITDTLSSFLDVILMNAEYRTDRGYLMEDFILYDLILVDSMREYVTTVDNSGIAIQINLKANGFIRKQLLRKFYKLQSFLAETGGVCHILYVMAYFLNFIHSIIHYNLVIDEECRISHYIERVII
jgi:hypothetical protein